LNCKANHVALLSRDEDLVVYAGDGRSDFDAAAMAFSLRRFMAIGTLGFQLSERVERVQVTAPYEIELVLKRPFTPLPRLLSAIFLTPVSPTAYRRHHDKPLNDRFVGTGPYALAFFGGQQQRDAIDQCRAVVGQREFVEGAPQAAVGCVDCHMPQRNYMVVDPRRDHSFRVPRPDLTEHLGVPNACQQCHRDKPPTWAAQQIKSWLGRDAAGFQHFGAALQAVRHTAPGAEASASRIFVRQTTTAFPAFIIRCKNCVGTSSLYRSSDAT
jgi:hypothetical protein